MKENDVKYLSENTGVVLKWGAVISCVVVIFALGVWVKGIEASNSENQQDLKTVKDMIRQVENTGTKLSRDNSADIRILQKDIDGIIKSLERNDSSHDKLMNMMEQIRTEIRLTKVENSPNNFTK